MHKGYKTYKQNKAKIRYQVSMAYRHQNYDKQVVCFVYCLQKIDS